MDKARNEQYKVDQIYLENSEMWCWIRMEKISWIDCVRNGSITEWRVKGERNILYTVKGREAGWIGHILHKNCLLKHIIEGKQEGRTKWREDEEEYVSSYWMTWRKRRDTGNLKRKHWIALCYSTLSGKRLWTWRKTDSNEWMKLYCIHNKSLHISRNTRPAL
jgi:hypothetical protein